MKITLDLPEIEGYEYTGEYRIAEPMEYFMEELQAVRFSDERTDSDYPILKKKAPKYETTYNGAYVEIKALEHAIAIIDSHYNWSADLRTATLELKELIK